MIFNSLKWAMLWALLIFILCSIPGRDIPSITWLELLSFDKWVHASVFFVLVYLTVRGLCKQNFPLKRAFVFSLLFAIPYGGLLEVMQGAFFQERSADVYDFIANSFGAIMCVIFFSKVNLLVSKFVKTDL